jgi:hypothetical protein
VRNVTPESPTLQSTLGEGLGPLLLIVGLKPSLLLVYVAIPAAKLGNHWKQLLACVKFSYKSIGQGQRISWHFATGNQDDCHVRAYAFYGETTSYPLNSGIS